MIDGEEKWLVQNAMMEYGGGFVNALGNALMRADDFNTQKIYDAFPEYWQKYFKMAMKI